MILNVYQCKYCDLPLPVAEGEAVTQCKGCKIKYFWFQETPSAAALDPKINSKRAARILSSKQDSKEISPEFQRRARTVSINLFYIPLFEVRRTEIAWASTSPTKPKTLTYHTNTSLDLGNNLSDLEIGLFDLDIINRSLLQSRTIPFNPTAIKREGIVLSFNEKKLLQKYQASLHPNILENMYRIIYFPIWEIQQIYQGRTYKSYISATSGEIIKISALKDHKKRIQYSSLGLFSMAILLTRGLAEGSMLTLVFLLIGIPMTIFLTPYFWDLYSSQELLEIKGSISKSTALHSSEDSLVETAKKWYENLRRIINKKIGGAGEEK